MHMTVIGLVSFLSLSRACLTRTRSSPESPTAMKGIGLGSCKELITSTILDAIGRAMFKVAVPNLICVLISPLRSSVAYAY